jgi:hypothetical protein
MRTTALPVSRRQFPSRQFPARSGLIARVPDFIPLTKPRATAFAAAWAAGVLKMWYDADIEAMMTRTSRRPIPEGEASRPEPLRPALALEIRLNRNRRTDRRAAQRRFTYWPGSTRNILPLALGVVIAILVAAGSVLVMDYLNETRMPSPDLMNMHSRH